MIGVVDESELHNMTSNQRQKVRETQSEITTASICKKAAIYIKSKLLHASPNANLILFCVFTDIQSRNYLTIAIPFSP